LNLLTTKRLKMKSITKRVSKNKSVTIIKNPGKVALDRIKAILDEKENQRKVDSENIHLYFPSK